MDPRARSDGSSSPDLARDESLVGSPSRLEYESVPVQLVPVQLKNFREMMLANMYAVVGTRQIMHENGCSPARFFLKVCKVLTHT